MAQSTRQQDPMTAGTATFEPDQSSPERAAGQVADAGWPRPGDEGYVHPDGTPQSVGQLMDNRRAAADRAAAGSILHGAPAVQRGGRPDATDIAVERARAAKVPTNAERDAELTRFIREGQDQLGELVAERAAADSGVEPADPMETVTPTAGPGGAPLAEPKTAGKSGGKS